jgi:hypothetical protein
MVAGIAGLSRIQLGQETVPGTHVVASTRWRGMGSALSDDRLIEEIEEQIGVIDGSNRTKIVQYLSGLEFAETPMTFEQIQYLLRMGFAGPNEGAADGVGTDFIYETPIPILTKPTATPLTIETGDDFEVERSAYHVATKIKLSGAVGQTARMSATTIGREAARYAGGFTAVSIPSVDEVVVNKGKVYLDAVSGDFGTTQVANVIIGFNIDIEIAWHAQHTLDGSLDFTTAIYTGKKISGELIYLHDTAAGGATGAKSFFRAQTAKLMRILLEDEDNVATPGTTYSKKSVIIDLPIKFRNPGIRGNSNGISTVSLPFVSKYDPTADTSGLFTVVNELATLP